MPSRLTPILLTLLLATGARALPPTIAPGLAGWVHVNTEAPVDLNQICAVDSAGVVAVAGRPVSFIASEENAQNYQLQVEWRWPGEPGNGGILLHISSGPKDRAWPLCYQVQLKHGAAGDLLPMAGATFAEPLSTPPGAKTPIRGHHGHLRRRHRHGSHQRRGAKSDNRVLSRKRAHRISIGRHALRTAEPAYHPAALKRAVRTDPDRADRAVAFGESKGRQKKSGGVFQSITRIRSLAATLCAGRSGGGAPNAVPLR